MKIDEKILVETGLSPAFVLKEAKLVEFLSRLDSACSGQGVKYALFGGTAINKTWLGQSLQRFSEDLDVHLFGCSLPKASQIISSLGAEKTSPPQQLFKEFYRFKLSYSDAELGVVDDFVNFDASLQLSAPKTKLVTRTARSFLSNYGFFLPSPSVYTYPAETLVAMKLLALGSRSAGKDFYDLYQLLKTVPFDSSVAMGEVHKYQGSLFDFQVARPEHLKQAVGSMKKTSDKELAKYDSFITIENRPDWSLLKRELARLVKTRFAKYL